MKKIFTIAGLALAATCYSQTTTLNFSYDSSGNQTLRELQICINCREAATQDHEESYVRSPESEQILYYPNPVLEQLSVKWTNTTDKYVESLNVYSSTGQIMFDLQNLNDKTDAVINFSSLSEGLYVVMLNYNSGEQRTLKVVKKK